MAKIELRELEVFLALSEELHFGRTAERLGLTSSRVSQVLRDLERKVGGQLIYRTSRRVELTALGERFRQEMAPAHDQLVRALERTAATVRLPKRTVRLGLFSDPGVSQVAGMVRAFETAFPERDVVAGEVPLEDVFGPLRRGEMDLVVSWLPHGQSDLVTGPILSREPRVVAVASDHPFAEWASVSVEDLGDQWVMRFDTMPKEFHEAWIPSKTPTGRPIRSRKFSELSLGDRGRMTSELVYLIATGHVVHPTVPSFAHMFGHPDITYIPINDLPPLCSALVCLPRLSDAAVRDFITVARELVQTCGEMGSRGPHQLNRAGLAATQSAKR